MTPGAKVLVFGTKVATVVAVSSNGKNVDVAGDYSGWTKATNVRPLDGRNSG